MIRIRHDVSTDRSLNWLEPLPPRPPPFCMDERCDPEQQQRQDVRGDHGERQPDVPPGPSWTEAGTLTGVATQSLREIRWPPQEE